MTGQQIVHENTVVIGVHWCERLKEEANDPDLWEVHKVVSEFLAMQPINVLRGVLAALTGKLPRTSLRRSAVKRSIWDFCGANP